MFAAASLTDSFKVLATSFEKQQADVLVKLNFAGTPTLATQIEQGAQADVLASADAGIVYTTDVRAAGAKVQGVQIPAAYNVVAAYPIVVVKGAKNSAAAGAFIAYVLSAAGRSTLASFGFQPA